MPLVTYIGDRQCDSKPSLLHESPSSQPPLHLPMQYAMRIKQSHKKCNSADGLNYHLTLPYWEAVLPPSTEASSGPSVRP